MTDEEYNDTYDRAAPHVQVGMEFAYLCRMRMGEILKATKRQILDDGFDTLRSKGSNDAITLWTPRLRLAVRDAQRLPGDSIYLLHDARGLPYTKEAFSRAFREARGNNDWTFHDLKARGASNFDGDKQAASGHKDARMVATYDRKKKRIEATE